MRNGKKRKTLFTLLLIMLLSFSMASVSYAHSGRTDASGGHRDNQNKSGLGSYHYHCGGNPAHLHTGGVCPYAGNRNAAGSSTPGGNVAGGSAPAGAYTGKYKAYAGEHDNRLNSGGFAPEIYMPVYQQVIANTGAYLSAANAAEYLSLSNEDKVDFQKYLITALYDQQAAALLNASGQAPAQAQVSQPQSAYVSAIFDPAYYGAAYPDLAALRGNAEALYTHFTSSGMAEGRQGCAGFNVYVYIQNNPDLAAVFGGNLPAYYQHYLSSGQYEGRIAH